MKVTMDSQPNSAGNNNTSSTTNSNRNSNRRGYNSNRRTNNNRSKKKPSSPKTKRKPTFVGLSADKINAVLIDEPGLDPSSDQLGRFEKEVLAYAKA